MPFVTIEEADVSCGSFTTNPFSNRADQCPLLLR
jgi:hypothetical protein